MADFFSNFFLVVIGALSGGALASLIIVYQIRKHFFRPKLYFKNVQVIPTKGEVAGDKFKWGGLVFTGDLSNDSDYWAYNVRIHDIYAEFMPNARLKLLDKTPLRLATDLPRIDNYKYFHANTQLQNIKPGEKITTSIRILTKKEISLKNYKQLIKELRMIHIKTKVIYENSSGYQTGTYFWLDFKFARFINYFGTRLTSNNFPKNGKTDVDSKFKIKSKIIEIESEPF